MESLIVKFNFSAIGNFSEENNLDTRTDPFSGLYDDIYVKIFSVAFALVGYLCLPAIGLVIWFERSGEAGNFRTLINQLVSCTLDQVRFRLDNLVYMNCILNLKATKKLPRT